MDVTKRDFLGGNLNLNVTATARLELALPVTSDDPVAGSA